METMFVDMNIKLPQIYNSSGINVTQVLVFDGKLTSDCCGKKNL